MYQLSKSCGCYFQGNQKTFCMDCHVKRSLVAEVRRLWPKLGPALYTWSFDVGQTSGFCSKFAGESLLAQ